MDLQVGLFINNAIAAQQTDTSQFDIGVINLLFPVVLIGAFYLMLIRPQNKRAKEHKKMINNLKKGDEVVTNGGILGRIVEIGDNFIKLELSDGVNIKIQKQSIGSLMPKGTCKSNL